MSFSPPVSIKYRLIGSSGYGGQIEPANSPLLGRCKQKIAPGGSEFPCSFFSLNVAYARMRWYARGLKEIAKDANAKVAVLLQDILTITRNLTIKASEIPTSAGFILWAAYFGLYSGLPPKRGKNEIRSY
jgi:hypothetical protein